MRERLHLLLLNIDHFLDHLFTDLRHGGGAGALSRMGRLPPIC
jgi:hypothetical protein